ncbi:MAG: hypothetical protein QNI99_15260 [Woeseiaceae bacterium]|nr:hypothetical protein [Woeseiaceae bacterium]
MNIDWLSAFADKWLDGAREGRMPHAVLLSGPEGVGKRAAAAWMARQRLSIGQPGDTPEYPFAVPEHADLRWLSRPEDKQSILIDQIRELVADLALTSYEGLGKVAVIEPADLMTHNAANSLLKTLEEPPGDTLLILVADRAGRLPATIYSRCQRIDFRLPAEGVALNWLDRVKPGASWAEALRVAGGAPIRALEAVQQLETSSTMARDFGAVASGQASPVEIAAAWAKQDVRFVLEWLAREVQEAARSRVGGVNAGSSAAIGDSVLQRMDSRNLFCYLDIINRLRGRPGGSFNVQLTLESLLIDWATGLKDVQET